MFFTNKRPERAQRTDGEEPHRLTDAILKNSSLGLFLLDARDRIQPQVSAALAGMFRREDVSRLSIEQLIAPCVTAKTLSAVRAHMARLLEGTPDESDNPLHDVEARLANPDGSFESAHYRFDFTPLANPRAWLVRVSDITAMIQQRRELVDLRATLAAHGEILRCVMQTGGASFGAFLQGTDAAMKSIHAVLKKPAREADAFRLKLEETYEQVNRVRHDAARLALSGLETAAQDLQDDLEDLRTRDNLSGGDFLPLAVKLDRLFTQFALLRTVSNYEPPPALPLPAAPAGSLESTLQSLTALAAHEQSRSVVLECTGLQAVPPRYQAAIKNIAIQLIRNAVLHGVEPTAEREAAGKPRQGRLRLEFRAAADQGFDLFFQDDGRGIDPDQVRSVAVTRGLLTQAEAGRLRDRQAIKLIFKSGFTTLEDSPARTHGAGMSLVRRYIHDAGGKISIASLPGYHTRFKINLPASDPAAAAAQEVA